MPRLRRRNTAVTEDVRRPLAVIIGIADYVLPRLRLVTPVRDAEALAAMLADHHGYEIRLVRDREASRAGLRALLEVELPAVLDEQRPVLIYFAGHGMATDSLDEPRGYLVPADGDGAVDSLLAMEDVARALARLPSRHLLLVLDCCFAGAFRWSAGRDVTADLPPTLYRERYERFLATPAWQVITSTAHDEQAADGGLAIGHRDAGGATHSPFLAALLKGLAGDADLAPRHPDGTAGDGVITATELYLYLRHQLEASAPADRVQTPGLWALPRHRKGEFIFYTPRAQLALPDAPALSLSTSPYRGFLVYKEQHAAVFHGRRAATMALLRHVEREPITVVVGSSGTGKSSLVRAGLVPALRAAHPTWQIGKPFRPGSALDAALDAVLDAETAPGTTRVVIVDQLEEVCLAPGRNGFLARLGELARDGVRVVATLRADLETALSSSPLAACWHRARFPLAAMTQDELRAAIEIPAAINALTFEPPAMVDRLINSVMAMPGALPLLSFTLHKLYVDCLRRGAHDRKLIEPGDGGVTRALREHTERLYAELDDATRATMRRVLLRMVVVHGGTIARRRVAIAELDAPDPVERSRIRAVLDALTGRDRESDFESTPPAVAERVHSVRLAVRGGSPTGGFVELAHDAVVADWPRVRSWLAEAGDALELQRAVTEGAVQWISDRHHAGYLWRYDPRLPIAERSLLAAPHQLSQGEAAFITASRTARRKATQRMVVVIAFVIAMVARVAYEWVSPAVRRDDPGVCAPARPGDSEPPTR